MTPGERPDADLAIAVARAGALAVLDLGRDADRAARAIARVAERCARFGVRVPRGVEFAPAALPPQVAAVIVPAGADLSPWAPRAVYVQVTSVDQARAAVAAGAAAIIAKGAESGGEVGDETTFVLLQRLLAAVDRPVYAQGGIGLHTAAACIAGGAAGVVVDAQLALARESTVPDEVRRAVAAMDGSETVVVGGHRVLSRPDLPVAAMTGAAPDDVRRRLGADDLRAQLVPVGQDAAFARPLADRYRTAGGIVAALRDAIGEHIAAARRARPLAPDAPLAAAHGLRYPIAQGPMTRVSDRAAFAEAVAGAGALPFVALSLLRGPDARALLDGVRERLGDRPWGVGLLGFAPPALRDEQLAAVRAARPPVALIAGGRPSQAAPLEADGIATYLHAPSPGLLDLFLRDGARRFVFEGRECGGHIGPRSSFSLWQQQIDRLMAVDDPGDLHVLFAGGIHDARSAAMVAAMAGPLAERGAKVGVLMGTAYLFTEEAVATGAIAPVFQQAALACDRTVVLETAPGHATRCVDTDYARAFYDHKRRLERSGEPPERVWEQLERLNVGRLRIAAKGLRRDGDRLVRVSEEDQRRDGLFMIGQVAALRGEVCSMAELHADVSEGATARIDAAHVPRPATPAEPPPADVAIVGMACIYPGAADSHAFWAHIVAGVNSVTEVPAERWNPALYYDPDATGARAGRKTPSKWGGFLPDVDFDPIAYGIPPKSLAAIEPVQLLALEVARRALADAGYADRPFSRERASVIFGAEAGTELSGAYGFRAMYPQLAGELPPELDEHLPSLTEDSFPGVLANVIAGRIANRLDLGGVNYTVDAACASSLAAVDLAVKELATGASDMVLCGGADVHNTINDYLLFASVHALSPSGQCRTFDASADGIALGEGVACVVLKRLADAERDGDRIYAVIRGIAGSSDGRSLGLTAPRREGQVRALERAYRRARVSPADVGLVEAHGTGTVVGDRTELAALTDVFERAGARPRSCAIGSVKSNIGHTKCAAGMAGLIKAARAVYAGVQPPTLHIERPNPAWRADRSPFVFVDRARPWPDDRRVAAVSALGFGGTNFHCVVSAYEGADRPEAGLDEWPCELVWFRAPDRAAAVERAGRLERALASDAPVRLRDVARTVTLAGDGPVQLAIVADSVADLRVKLAAACRGDAAADVWWADGAAAGDVAFLFPGQGSQRVGMLADLFVAFPRLQQWLARAGDVAARMFPPAAFSAEERAAQRAAVTDTRAAQPALGVAGFAMAELLDRLGVRAAHYAGHSYGELVALCRAGAMDFDALMALSVARAEAIVAAAGDDPGAMAAVAAPAGAVEQALAHAGIAQVVVANRNAPAQTVIAGPTAAIARAVDALAAAGMTARALNVACAFHSPVVAGARDALARAIDRAGVAAPEARVWANATAAPYPADAAAVRALLASQVARPVRFTEQIEAMYAAGARVFVEVGPGRVLTRLVELTLGDRPHRAIPTDVAGDHGLRALQRALAQLATSGVAVDPAALYAGRDTKELDMRQPLPGRSASTWKVNGYRATPASGEPPRGAYRPTPVPVVAPPRAGAQSVARATSGTRSVAGAGTEPGSAPGSEAAVVEYLRNMREVIAAQRDVMLAWLGARPAADRPARAGAAPAVAAHPAPAHAAEGDERAVAPASPPADAPASPAADAAAPAPQGAAQARDLRDVLLAIVAERTGYPVDMLGLDLDLEAELSIDSIKRIEILGELRDRVGLGARGGQSEDEVVEQLASVKTLRGILDFLSAPDGGDAAAGDAPPANEAAATDAPPDGRAATDAPPDGRAATDAPRAADAARIGTAGRAGDHAVPAAGAPRRFVVTVEPAPPPALNGTSFDGARVAVVDDGGGVAQRLASALADLGARAEVVDAGAAHGDRAGGVDGLIDLAPLAAGATCDAVARAFPRVRAALAGGARWLAIATPNGGRFGDGAARVVAGAGGMVKALAREFPAAKLRALDFDRADGAERIAERIRVELLGVDRVVEAGYAGGDRFVRTVVPAPAPDAAVAALLDRDSVVVATGGARGITARAVVELARRYRCRFELVGRTPLPPDGGGDDPELAAAGDARALRSVLAARGVGSPADIEAECRRLLAVRAIRATLAEIARAGGEAVYHAVDVRDTAEWSALVDAIYARHGRIDGVLHGAGVVEDKLARDKTPESFSRVFATKVASAVALADRLRDDVRFVALFGSVSGVFGNRGQVDYAAANDALDAIARWLDRRIAGRAVAIDWGPWDGGGMVSDELRRAYARRGVQLIDPDAGVAALCAELAAADGPSQVVWMCAEPAAFSLQPAAPAVDG
ncbi:MAG: SDR family oxidoreductase [Deltaproteobacteria bacterium]|nr:MAG: SDR family oxidoreductase [Deltaproteobacteria bacterium]